MTSPHHYCCKYCAVKVNVVIFVFCVIIVINGAGVAATKLRRRSKTNPLGVGSLHPRYSLSAVCPKMCSCDSAQTALRCDAKNLTIVPIILAINVEMLNLSANQIRNLLNNSFTNLDRLRTLHLEHNQILFIHPLSFRHLRSLQFLYLQHNKLKDLDPTTFTNLPALTSLQLSNNALDHIPAGLFNNSSQLQKLDLEGNSISSIQSSAFSNLTNLTELDLSHNPLHSFEPALWVPLRNLALLNLSSTNASIVHPNIFKHLSNLKVLDLSNITLGQLDPSQFHTLKELKVVNVSGSSVTCDCNAVNLRQWLDSSGDISKFQSIKSVFCAQPENLAGKPLLAIPVSDLTCKTARLVLKSPSTIDPRTVWQREPLPYDPLLGWYTAATLSTMLILFLLCIGLDRVKNKLIILRYKRKKAKRRRLRGNDSSTSSPLQGGLYGTCGREETTDNELLDDDFGQDPDNQCGVLPDSQIHNDTQNDSTVSPDDQPIMFRARSPQGIMKADPSTRKNLLLSGREACKVAKVTPNNDRISRLGGKKQNSIHGGVQDVVRPDTLLTLDTSQSDTIVPKAKPGRKPREAKDLLKMHVIAVHPDCPIHNPQKSKALERENTCESTF